MRNHAERKFDITRYVSPRMLPRLRTLGKHDWMQAKHTPQDDGTVRTCCELDPLSPGAADILASLPQCDAISYMYLFVVSKAVAGGLKIVTPTVEQCEAMAQTEAQLPFADFRAPYPSLIVSWPKGWKPFKQPFEVTWLQELDGATATITQDTHIHVENLLSYHHWPTIEDAIQYSEDAGTDIDAAKLCQRVAINLCLLMTIHRWSEKSVESPAERRTKKLMRSRHNRKRRHGQAILDSLPRQTILSIDQNIKLLDRVEYEGSGGEGRPKKPHWRRGYFRRQAYGSGRSKHRTIYIRPVMVNRSQFLGEDGDTTVTYQV